MAFWMVAAAGEAGGGAAFAAGAAAADVPDAAARPQASLHKRAELASWIPPSTPPYPRTHPASLLRAAFSWCNTNVTLSH